MKKNILFFSQNRNCLRNKKTFLHFGRFKVFTAVELITTISKKHNLSRIGQFDKFISFKIVLRFSGFGNDENTAATYKFRILDIFIFPG